MKLSSRIRLDGVRLRSSESGYAATLKTKIRIDADVIDLRMRPDVAGHAAGIEIVPVGGVADRAVVDRGDRIDHGVPVLLLLIQLRLRRVRLIAGRGGIEIVDVKKESRPFISVPTFMASTWCSCAIVATSSRYVS